MSSFRVVLDMDLKFISNEQLYHKPLVSQGRLLTFQRSHEAPKALRLNSEMPESSLFESLSYPVGQDSKFSM